jgi:hypothetical protein
MTQSSRPGNWTSASSVINMPTRTSMQATARAQRFGLHLPVYYRDLDGQGWFEGWTENISRTGMLFRCNEPFRVDTAVELKLQLAAGMQKEDHHAEVQCKGTVLRVEQMGGLDARSAMAVAIHPYRITRGNAPFKDSVRFG